MDCSFSRQMERASFDWPIVLQYDVKAKYRLISRKFSGMKCFHPSARLYPFDKPIKSLYFRSFVVSVLFVRFHFKVIRKSLCHGIVRASTCFSTEEVSKSRRVRSLLPIRSSEGSSPVVEYGVFR